jgi:hypothetical protein
MRFAPFPLWVKLPASGGIAAMSAFLPTLTETERWIGFGIGAALFLWAVIGAFWHYHQTTDGFSKAFRKRAKQWEERDRQDRR